MVSTWQIIVFSVCLRECTANTCSKHAENTWRQHCMARTEKNKILQPLAHMQSSEINIDANEIQAKYTSARLQALKFSGQAGSQAIHNLRKKSKDWYQISLRRMMTYVCDEISSPIDYQRCVDPASPYAAKDASNQCILVNDAQSCTRNGLCERKSNCRWDDAMPNASYRREFFRDENISIAKIWTEEKYATSFAKFLIPGTVLAIVLSVSFVAFILFRCVFNQCGGRNPREKGYSRCDLLIPLLIFLLCFVAVFICAVFTSAQNTNITEEVHSIFYSMKATLSNIGIFADNFAAPLEQAQKLVEPAQSLVKEKIKDTEWIVRDAKKFQDMVDRFSETYALQGPFPFSSCIASEKYCIPCPDRVCKAAVGTFSQSLSEYIASNSGAVQRTVQTMIHDFAHEVPAISTALGNSITQIRQVANLSSASLESVQVLEDLFKSYSFSRTALVICVFFFMMLGSVLGLIGLYYGIVRKLATWTNALHASWILNTLVCILGFVLSSALLAIGALWFDSCQYIEILRTDMSPYFPTRLSSIVNTCLQDASVLTSLGIQESLQFSCALEDDYFALGAADVEAFTRIITRYGDNVKDYGLSDFGYDVSLSRQLLSKATNAVVAAGKAGKVGFTQENILFPWKTYDESLSAAPECSAASNDLYQAPVCYMKQKCGESCSSEYAKAYYYVSAFNQIDRMLEQMQEDLLGDTGKGFSPNWNFDVSLLEFARSYQNQMSAFRSETLQKLKSNVMTPILEAIEAARCSDNCGWINIAYNEVYDDLCNDVLGTTLSISLCSLFLSLFLIPMIVTAIILQKRIRGTKQGTYEFLERRLQMLELKAREEARAKVQPSPIPQEKATVSNVIKSKLRFDVA